MSEIDKLVNRAFPDELRNVEPVDVDEDAILALTLEKLGLGADEPEPAEEIPEERRPAWVRGAKPQKERKLVEAPMVAVGRQWVNWAGWAVAACLILVFAINWGPWLLSNLGFGTARPQATGVDSEPVHQRPWGPDTLVPANESPAPSQVEPNQILTMENPSDVAVTPVSAAYNKDGTFVIRLDITGRDGAQVNVDWLDITLTTLDGEAVEQTARSHEDGKVFLTYRNKTGEREYFQLTVRQLVPMTDTSGNQAGFNWSDVEILNMNLEYGTAASQISNESMRFHGFAYASDQEGSGGQS